MPGGDRFDLFITDLFRLYNRLAQEIGSNRQFVVGSSRRAVAVLRAYRPEDDGEAILIDTAIEEFEALARKAGAR